MYPVLLVATTLLDLVFLGVILQQGSARPVRRSYALLAGTLASWGGFRILELITAAPEPAAAFRRTAMVAFSLVPALYLAFVQAATGRQRLARSRVELGAALVASAVFAGVSWAGGGLVVDLVPRDLDPVFQGVSPYRYGFGLFMPAVVFLGLGHVAAAARRTGELSPGVAMLLLGGALAPIAGREVAFLAGPTRDSVAPELAFVFASLGAWISAAGVLVARSAPSLSRAAGAVGDSIGEALLVTDALGRVEYANAAALALIGGDPRTQQVRRLFDGHVAAALDGLAGGGSRTVDSRLFRLDGAKLPVAVSASAHRRSDGRVDALVLVARDMSATEGQVVRLQLAKDQLERAALTDPLTGLRNRRYLSERLVEECARARRYRAPFGVALLDLDGFKAVNDGWGHAAGDDLLIRVAQALRHAVRDSDLVARLGGDEFVVLLLDLTPATCGVVRERLEKALAAIEIPGGGGGVRASVGFSFWDPEIAAHPDVLLAMADAAMYQVKREHGRGTWAEPAEKA